VGARGLVGRPRRARVATHDAAGGGGANRGGEMSDDVARSATDRSVARPAADATERFQAQHAYLFAIAYRMLGSRAEAEDVLQDAWLRFAGADVRAIDSDRAFLATIVSRLCLDRMTSSAARRETYVGPWLPEPLRAEPDDAPGADDRLGLAESVSIALLRVLESLSPVERAVLLLREVFEFDYDDLADMLQTSPEACRQHLHRARAHLQEHRPPRNPTREQQTRLALAFFSAAQVGDTSALAALLTEDARAISDSGGAVPAPRKQIRGRDAVARFLVGVNRKGAASTVFEAAWLNGGFGVIARTGAGGPIRMAAVLETDGERVSGIFITLNPEKLAGL
jgi:RNA polymerase sigma-70 factor (ECF subfamily)